MIKRAILDVDDFSLGTALANLKKIKEHYPNFKCSVFMIPCNMSLLTGDLPYEKYKVWAEIVKENLDWIEICLHGFGHTEGEMDCDKKTAKMIVKAGENMMKDLGLPHAKIFKAPFWQMSDDAYKVLKGMGYTVAVDRNQPPPKIKGLKTYTYNWSIDEILPQIETIKAHAHFYSCNNGIEGCMSNLFELPEDIEWLFISEYLNLYGKNFGN